MSRHVARALAAGVALLQFSLTAPTEAQQVTMETLLDRDQTFKQRENPLPPL